MCSGSLKFCAGKKTFYFCFFFCLYNTFRIRNIHAGIHAAERKGQTQPILRWTIFIAAMTGKIYLYQKVINIQRWEKQISSKQYNS